MSLQTDTGQWASGVSQSLSSGGRFTHLLHTCLDNHHQYHTRYIMGLKIDWRKTKKTKFKTRTRTVCRPSKYELVSYVVQVEYSMQLFEVSRPLPATAFHQSLISGFIAAIFGIQSHLFGPLVYKCKSPRTALIHIVEKEQAGTLLYWAHFLGSNVPGTDCEHPPDECNEA
jgi:hypothetical protein